jgi:hypothetical protein
MITSLTSITDLFKVYQSINDIPKYAQKKYPYTDKENITEEEAIYTTKELNKEGYKVFIINPKKDKYTILYIAGKDN